MTIGVADIELSQFRSDVERGKDSTWERAPHGIAIDGPVAILCPGPSLADAKVSEGWSIAVNGAAGRRTSDWGVSWDMEPLESCCYRAKEGVLTRSRNWGEVPRKLHAPPEAVVVPVALSSIGTRASKFGAFILAAWLRAPEARIYGDDMSGDTYHGGSPCDASEGRWERERAMQSEVIGWLEANSETRFTWD